MMGKEALSSAFSEMILEEAKKDKNINGSMYGLKRLSKTWSLPG